METKDLLAAYNVIKWAMEQNERTSYNNSFMVVKNWLATTICDRLEDKTIIQTSETLNNINIGES